MMFLRENWEAGMVAISAASRIVPLNNYDGIEDAKSRPFQSKQQYSKSTVDSFTADMCL